MNPAHWHLLLNHIPVIGTFLGVLLLLYGLARKSDEVKQASLGILVMAAVVAIPAFLTGEPAEEIAEHLPGVSHAVIERHEDIAKIALILMSLTGIIALVGLFLRQRAQWLVPMALVFGLISAGAMGYAANLGGQVRHTEIRSDGAAASTSAIEGQRKPEHKDDH
ncbi:MAG: hypothetical protein JST84_17545 [Acidobacteria bacterium]|nr:hypothetical protein [Acidobacteriota bacterium]